MGQVRVYVVMYTHKHGVDIDVHKTEQFAYVNMDEIMFDRVKTWQSDDAEAFNAIPAEDVEAKLTKFHEVESEINYGETLELLERPLCG